MYFSKIKCQALIMEEFWLTQISCGSHMWSLFTSHLANWVFLPSLNLATLFEKGILKQVFYEKAAAKTDSLDNPKSTVHAYNLCSSVRSSKRVSLLFIKGNNALPSPGFVLIHYLSWWGLMPIVALYRNYGHAPVMESLFSQPYILCSFALGILCLERS